MECHAWQSGLVYLALHEWHRDWVALVPDTPARNRVVGHPVAWWYNRQTTMIKCEQCSEPTKNRHFCSRKCLSKSQRKWVVVACDQCKKDLERSPSRVRRHNFCDKKCKDEWQSGEDSPYWKGGLALFKCAQCHKDLERAPSQVGERTFCDQECYYKWQSENLCGEDSPNWAGGPITLTCKQCKNEYTVDSYRIEDSNFCSRECHGKWRSENLAGANSPFWERVKTKCAQCYKDLELQPCIVKEHNFCSNKCRGKWGSENLSGKNAPNWKGGLSFDPYPPTFNEPFKRTIRERDNYICAICWLPGKHVHHIDYNKQNTVLKNCITLCVNCHATTNSNRSYWQTQLSQLQEARHTRPMESLATLS